MNDEQSLTRAMAITEVAVQQMAEEGIKPMHRAIGLAFHMQAQAELAMPSPETAAAFKASIATT
ncbi:hypothetical protein AB3Y40_06895 [Yoonia sp. R2331]|uniref:hypothetical protein n=1 Tax=Yoonia sp. R2331 TaxID=3237238 RepID=UPI0034E40EA3